MILESENLNSAAPNIWSQRYELCISVNVIPTLPYRLVSNHVVFNDVFPSSNVSIIVCSKVIKVGDGGSMAQT